jgi:hypothetical protein
LGVRFAHGAASLATLKCKSGRLWRELL